MRRQVQVYAWRMGLTERTEVEEAVKAVLKQFCVEGLLQVQILQHIHEHPMRAYRGRLSGVRRDLTFTLISSREETAIAKAMSQLGWGSMPRTFCRNT